MKRRQANQIWCAITRRTRSLDCPDEFLYRLCLGSAGSGWASSVTAEGLAKMKERIRIAVMAGRKAIEVGPQFGRSWGVNVRLGIGAEFKPEMMERIFKRPSN
jgi:hypothetical protein